MKHLSRFNESGTRYDFDKSPAINKYEELREYFMDLEIDGIIEYYSIGTEKGNGISDVALNQSTGFNIKERILGGEGPLFFVNGIRKVDDHYNSGDKLVFQIGFKLPIVKNGPSPGNFLKFSIIENLEIFQIIKRLENEYETYIYIDSNGHEYKPMSVLLVEK